MELLDVVTSSIWVVLSSVVPFLVVLTLIVFVHEYGHFKVARWCGVGIETFAVGFGREIIGKTDKYGTRWKLGWIPIGGYVKFEDDANAASMPASDEEPVPDTPPSETAFHSKPLPSRAAVVAAGPAANFILAIIIYTLSFMYNGERVSQPIADAIMKGSAAEQAGMMSGDRIAEIDGSKVEKFSDIKTILAHNQGSTIDLVIFRKDERIELSATPQVTQQKHPLGGTMDIRLLGIKSKTYKTEERSFTQSVGLGVGRTWDITTLTLTYVAGIIRGKESTKQLSGPLGIARTTGLVTSQGGINALFQLAALLSVSIGLINLFPIPMLDGGHLMYYAAEAVRGKPLGQNAQDIGFKVGFAVVLTLMIVATWNDVARFFSS